MPSPSSPDAVPAPQRQEVETFLRGAGLMAPGDTVTLAPLSGGVSSDIWLATGGDEPVVVKTPLQVLRVEADWQAPLSRSEAEARWLATASRLVPGMCPDVLAYDDERHLLALRYLTPADHRVWKDDLLRGVVDPSVAPAVGRRLGRLHRLSSAQPDLADEFANESLFRALRIEPYFESLFVRHPDLRLPITEVIETTLGTRTALVHGDVSPKNILVGPSGPVLLDAETAHWGDPAFDVAFCLNHVLLKCMVHPRSTDGLLHEACGLLGHYMEESGASPALDARVARLLPVLMLARVDGRSPVEYLTEHDRVVVRALARAHISERTDRSADIFEAWRAVAA